MNNVQKIEFHQLLPIITETVKSGNSFTFTAFGNSMYPTIRGGIDRVTLSPVTSEILPGDIVFYRRDSKTFVLHRVIAKKGNTFLLCGDNQYTVEHNVTKEQMIARLTSIERNGIKKAINRSKLMLTFLLFKRPVLHLLAFMKKKFK